jgi:hypothetical protein
MENQDTLAIIVAEAGKVLLPLEKAVSSPEEFQEFLYRLGWTPEDIPAPVQAIASEVVVLKDALQDAVEGDFQLQQVEAVRKAVANVIKAVEDIADAPDSAIPAKLRDDDFKTEFPAQLIEFLLTEYLQYHQKTAAFFLKSLGIIRAAYQPQSGERLPYTKYIVDFSQITDLFEDPSLLFQNAYGWGTDQFDFDLLFRHLDNFFFKAGVDVLFETVDTPTLIGVAEGIVPAGDPRTPVLRLVFFQRYRTTGRMAAEVRLVPLPGEGATMPGLALLPYFNGALDLRMELGENIAATLSADSELEGGIALVFRPEEGLYAVFGFDGVEVPSGAQGQIDVKFEHSVSGEEPTVVLGQRSGSRLEYQAIAGKGGVALTSDGGMELFAELELIGGKVVITAGEGDGFLQKILPGGGVTSNFDLAVGLSNLRKFYFRGSGGLEINLPLHVDLGILEMNNLALGLSPGDGGLKTTVGTDIKVNLGPLKAVVENMGIKAEFSFPESGGNLGPVDLDIGFKPPNGVGLSIEAGVVKGGGYLFFDFEREEYAGALELVFSEIVALKAIGLITTRMPDGSKGFSLLIIITAEFGSGIQLGFGFTLLGVGGLLGLNRTMRLEPLAEGVRTGAVNGIMFPTNVVENAPRIISDLRTYFPPQADIFLIGPLAKFGWGTPTLISLSLGIIIEIPGNIAILGVLKVALPDEDAALLVLQVNFIGAIEFDKERAWFFASMFDSRVLFITLEGEMGLLIGWGDNPNFVVSVGGFHPRYSPPPLPFPNPKRVSLNILDKSYARIRVEGYFAVTSNTVQFGARAELFFGLSEFKIEGHLAFDALFQFSPFFFIIEFSSKVSVKVFGIGLFSIRVRGSLEGPTPYRVEGTGSISLLLFDIDVDFSVSWGEERDTTLPPIEVLPILEKEFQDLSNWTAALPASSHLLVSLQQLGEAEELVLHPVGTLRISQRRIPLQITLDKVGNQKPADVNKFTVEASGGLDKRDDAREQFATAQYQDLSDAAKLSLPAFQPQASGLELSTAGEQWATGIAVMRNVRYEKIIIDSHYKRFILPLFAFFGVLFAHFLKGGAVTKLSISQKRQKQMQPFAVKIEVRAPEYTVAFNSNNKPFSEDAARFASEALAREFMKARVAENPELAEAIHVIPQHEVNTAA